MASNYCIPPEIARNLIAKAKEGDVIGDIARLSEMSSQERRSAFAKHVGDQTAREINASFEKVIAKNEAKALVGWVNDTFSGEVKKSGGAKTALEKIAELDEKGLLTPEESQQFYEDLVSEKLGVSVTADEARTISEMAQEVEKLATKMSDKTGLPVSEYWQAKDKLEKYIQAQMPASNLRVFSSTIGRGMMLASVKSPIVNIESNTLQAMLTAMERRFSTNQYGGLNGDLAKTFMSENWKIYKKAGYDLSRMMSMSDGQKVVGEEITHSEGKGGVRWVGRGVEDIVFKYMMGAPDVFYASMHFADSANLGSSKIALSENLTGDKAKARARTIMLDALQIEPKTIEGEIVRAQAIADAQYATYTDKTTYSDTALAIRKVFNTMSGDFRVGDQIMPFVKTPANVVGAGIDYSGVALPAQVILLPKALMQARRGEKEALKRSIRAIVRGGLGMTFAFLLSQIFEPEEFIGNYPTSEKERKLLEEQNATPNSVKIGDKWVSLDYFGVLSAPFIGLMYAKKYGHTPVEATLKYYQGVAQQAFKIPGFQDFTDIVKSSQDLADAAKTGSDELVTAGTNIALDFARSRIVPGIVNDVAKATDSEQRDADIKQDPLARIKSSIPGLRQSLPVKETETGATIPTEPAWSTILFGNRVKTANTSPVVEEFGRLNSEGQLPSITGIEETKRVERLKEQLGNSKRYEEALDYYYETLQKDMENTIKSGKYKSLNDEEKRSLLDNVKQDTVDAMLKRYGYKEPKKKDSSTKKKSSTLL